MRKLGVAGALALGVILSPAAAKPAAQVGIESVPGWVHQDLQPDYAAPLPEKTETGYDYLLIDEQEDVEHRGSYSRHAYRITSNAALQDAAQVSVDYDPACQTVDFHFVRVIRGSAVSDRLALDKIRTFEQERDLERHQINGEMTALLVLDDVRVGDVIDCAYTRYGRNPIFGDHFRFLDTVNWHAPIRQERVRVVADAGHKLFWKQHGARVLTASRLSTSSQVAYVWTGTDVPAVEVDPLLPGWYAPYAFLQITDFPDWPSVVRWAEPLYAVPAPIPETVAEKADDLTAGVTDLQSRAVKLLNFVQQDIRYLGIQLGPHSHRPSPPEQVLERRYGDCKDKALLLCTMLRHAGVDAAVALTHDARRQTMRDWLPSPDVFDHVIVTFDIDGQTYWVDPTLTDQTGELPSRGIPDYQLALPIAGYTVKLLPVEPAPASHPAVNVKESYSVTEIGKPALLDITTEYHGAFADAMRASRRKVPEAQMAKYVLNLRARLYARLSPRAPPAWKDDDAKDTLTCTESYTVPDLWQETDDNAPWKAEFYPLILHDYVQAPTSLNRSMPLGVADPIDISYAAVIRLPSAFPVDPVDLAIHDDAFLASARVRGTGQEVTLHYRYQSLADHVPPPRVAAYAENLRPFREHLGYTLQYNPRLAAWLRTFKLNWALLAIGLITVGAAAGGSWWCYRRPPPVERPYVSLAAQSLAGLDGWLILVGIGVVLRPLTMVFNFLRIYSRFFDERVWLSVTNPTKAAFHPSLGPLITVEMVVHLGLIVTGSLLAVMFFRKKRLFPTILVAWLAISAVYQVADSIAAAAVLDQASVNPAMAVIWALASGVWILYALFSRRVRATFVQ